MKLKELSPLVTLFPNLGPGMPQPDPLQREQRRKRSAVETEVGAKRLLRYVRVC